jgi:hypothetical protein
MSPVNALAIAAALAISSLAPAAAAPIAQPGITPAMPAIDRVDYEPRKRPACPGQYKRGYYTLNPGRYDTWLEYGPYEHKHYGGQRWHDLNYNGCAPWWHPAPYASAAARKAFKTASRNPHVRWCLERYRSYDPATDTYVNYDGNRRRCVGPS